MSITIEENEGHAECIEKNDKVIATRGEERETSKANEGNKGQREGGKEQRTVKKKIRARMTKGTKKVYREQRPGDGRDRREQADKESKRG